MDEKQGQLIATGYPEGSGQKERFIFTCMSCGGRVVTQGQYATGRKGVLQGALEDQARYGLSSLLYRIPVVGYFLSSMLSRTLGARGSAGMERRMGDARTMAFNEVRDRFSPCTQCGAYACPSCFSDGLCTICRQTRNATRMAGDAQREAGTGKEQAEGGAKDNLRDPTKMWD